MPTLQCQVLVKDHKVVSREDAGRREVSTTEITWSASQTLTQVLHGTTILIRTWAVEVSSPKAKCIVISQQKLKWFKKMFYVVILLFSTCVTHLYGVKSFVWGVVALRYCTYNSVVTLSETLSCTRNCSFYRNGNLANFFRMLVKAKYFKGCLPLLEME